MQRDFITAQHGQGWLISFAVLILVGAIGAVAYTVINSSESPRNSPPTPKASPPAPLSQQSVQEIASALVGQHVPTQSATASTEDIQALSNTLQHLKDTPKKAAQQALQLLQQSEIAQAVTQIKSLALDTTNQRDAAKFWVDVGNIESLHASEQAISAYQKAVTLDNDNINAWNRIGHLERQQQHYEQAEIAYRNVTRLSDELSQTQALSFANFGLLHQSQKQYDAAIQSFTDALAINQQLSNRAGIASNSENLASLYRLQKKYELAETHYRHAFDIYQQEKQTTKLIEIHSALGSLYQTRQQTELALSEYEKALSLNQQHPKQRFSAALYANMGILAQQRNELKKAEEYFKQALTHYQTLKQPSGIADQYSNLAILARSRKQFSDSEHLHLKAIELYQQQQQTLAITNQYTNLGFLYTAWDKHTQACEYWTKSLAGLQGSTYKSRRVRIEAIVARDCQADTNKEHSSSAKTPSEDKEERPSIPHTQEVVDTPKTKEADTVPTSKQDNQGE